MSNPAEELLRAWVEMDNAAQQVSTALPRQMSEAVDRMDRARIATRDVVQRISMQMMQEAKP